MSVSNGAHPALYTEAGGLPPERPVPYDIPAEESTLGALLLNRDAVIKVAATLAPWMFYREVNGAIYQAILDLYDRREPPDLQTLTSELDQHGKLEYVGGPAYLASLMYKVPTAVHVEYYGDLVLDRAIRRRLITAGGQIAGLGFEEGITREEMLDRAETILSGVRLHALRKQVRSPRELMAKVQKLIGAGGQGLIGLPTGLTDLDGLLGGLCAEDLITVAARPRVGKSTFGNTLVYNLAVRPLLVKQAPTPVGVASFEMSAEQYLLRLVALHAGVSTSDMRLGLFTEEQWAKVEEGLAVVYEAPIYFDGDDETGDSDVSIYSLRRRMRRMRADHDIRLMIVDYLQQMSGKRPDNRNQEVGEITRGLKQSARELAIPIVAMSQLSRGIEHRRDHLPVLSDLRESGSIEQDSDIVMFIHREELYHARGKCPAHKQGLAEFHVAKHRNGPGGVVPLRFTGATTSFSDWDGEYEGEEPEDAELEREAAAPHAWAWDAAS